MPAACAWAAIFATSPRSESLRYQIHMPGASSAELVGAVVSTVPPGAGGRGAGAERTAIGP